MADRVSPVPEGHRQRVLTEEDVIKAVASHLERHGWTIRNTSRTNQRGIDILAEKRGKMLAIEAKGGTSNRPGSARFGLSFTKSQKLDHVSKALYTATRAAISGDHQGGIAVPADEEHKRLIQNILPALKTLDIAAFLVEEDRTVRKAR